MTAAGYLCYLRSIHRIISESDRLPWRDELLKLSPQRLSIVVLLVFVAVVLIKAYAIGIVWRCYKYLTIRQHNLRSMLPYIIPDMTARQERDYNTLLPDYEEAIAQSLKQPPPPSYQMAMAYSMANQQVTGLQVNLETLPTTSVDNDLDEQPTATSNEVTTITNAIVNQSAIFSSNEPTVAVANANEATVPAEFEHRNETVCKPY